MPTRVWIVDPVDGTREFSLPGRTDWAVHVALWQRFGAAGAATFHTGGPDGGINRRRGSRFPLVARSTAPTQVTATAAAAPTAPIRINGQRQQAARGCCWRLRDRMDIEMVRIGSAGAKAMAVVRGDRRRLRPRRRSVGVGLGRPGRSGAGRRACTHRGWTASPMIYNRRDPYLPDLLDVSCRAGRAYCWTASGSGVPRSLTGMDRASGAVASAVSNAPSEAVLSEHPRVDRYAIVAGSGTYPALPGRGPQAAPLR